MDSPENHNSPDLVKRPTRKAFFIVCGRICRKTVRVLDYGWSRLAAVLLLLMAVIPGLEMLGRAVFRNGFNGADMQKYLYLPAGLSMFIETHIFNGGIVGATDYLRHLTLWVGFFGAILAIKENKHLKIGNLNEWLPGKWRRLSDFWSCFLSSIICWALCGASIKFVVSEAPAAPKWLLDMLPEGLVKWLESLEYPGADLLVAGWIPVWVAELIIPLGFATMAICFSLRPGKRLWVKVMGFLSLPFAIVCASQIGYEGIPAFFVWSGIIILLLSAIIGAPIFVLIGGSAILLFLGNAVPTSGIPIEMYRIAVSQVFPTIPLFTLAGFILSESKASGRLVEVFRSLFGWAPGGTAVAVTLLCAFFTTFTGASGITILALGGLLLPVLVKSGYKERFSIGLLTATGSLGLLFPPSLVVILYGVVAHVPIVDMFKAGLVPGALMVLPVCVMCVWQGMRKGENQEKVGRDPFDGRKALKAIWETKWELLIPVVALFFIFSGYSTVVEAAALTVMYTLFVEMAIYRDIGPKGLVSLLIKCVVLVGGVLIVLSVAMGLTSFLVDAQVPMHATNWARENLQSPWVFLLALNFGLIIVGCLMDIYSAIIIVVPLILPIAAAFNISPVHLGIIFLANLQLGYLTPPVGMNLFLAAFRFDKSLMKVAKYAMPFLLVLLIIVLLITYIPWLSVGVQELLTVENSATNP